MIQYLFPYSLSLYSGTLWVKSYVSVLLHLSENFTEQNSGVNNFSVCLLPPLGHTWKVGW